MSWVYKCDLKNWKEYEGDYCSNHIIRWKKYILSVGEGDHDDYQNLFAIRFALNGADQIINNICFKLP